MKLPSQLNCFLKVAEYKNFSLAAESLHITTTAVSKQIKNLESTIKEPLFIRTTRIVTLTDIGEMLYKRCKILNDEMSSITQLLESKKSEPQGPLKVLVSTILSKSFVLNHLREFVEKYPLIELDIVFSEEDTALSYKDVDVMVGFPAIPPYTDQLKYKKMFQTKNVLCASPAYLKKYGQPVKPADLLNAKFISHSLRKDNFDLPLANNKRLACAKPIVVMNNFEALNQACCDGIGLFLTADSLIQTELATRKLIRILPNIPFATYDIYMFYRPYDFDRPKIRAFVDFYLSRLKPNPNHPIKSTNWKE